MRAICLGEAIVDLISPRALGPAPAAPGHAYDERPELIAQPGGVMANVAIAAAHAGADVGLAGGAGQDAWGRWLHDRLCEAGVAVENFELVPGCQTPVAFVTAGEDGEPHYDLRGDGIAATVAALGEDSEGAVGAASAVCISSNTMVDEPERELTLSARRQALTLGRPVIYDVGLRLHRWPHAGRASSVARACVPDAFLVKANRQEARALTGESTPERAAEGLLAAGARNVLVTMGADGALLRGEVSVRVPARRTAVVNTAGAGDVLLGVLLARLTQSGYYAPSIAAALPEAMAQAALSVSSWEAVPRR